MYPRQSQGRPQPPHDPQAERREYIGFLLRKLKDTSISEAARNRFVSDLQQTVNRFKKAASPTQRSWLKGAMKEHGLWKRQLRK